ncbi:polysaccharide deacetylase family sporulation protein PdaB [Shouchella lonarensis]|uniref:Polysaccharide deacetylase family sporulation protein PdaB n=1 Tax=Shouchella lonarensis TaxID=1464122 RepID=A0A1G6P788_9BACI|nr:polysaccharide deacetylase family sporulation protein PdaB [Shouchella lonarensis]SDC75949.1 polysaccharide deacetylase family sporulation protein PdaB [Shouchella lonarensis]
MKGIWVLNIRRRKPLIFICVAAMFVASWLFIAKEHVSVFSTSEGPQAFYRANDAKQSIALTFNISWGEKRVAPIVKLLQDHDVEHATFFLLASWAEKYPDLVEVIQEAGYQIGSHGYRYKDYTMLDDEEVIRDMRRSKEVLQQLTDTAPTLLRPPNGAFTKQTLALADEQSFDVVHWSVNSYDYKNPGTEAIIENTLSHTQAGDVLLFHASDSVKQTEQALPTILTALKKQGYTFVTIHTLMDGSSADSEIVE